MDTKVAETEQIIKLQSINSLWFIYVYKSSTDLQRNNIIIEFSQSFENNSKLILDGDFSQVYDLIW